MDSCGKCCAMTKLAKVLVIIGALNWGLVGLGGFMGSNWNLVNMLLGSWPQVEWVVYILVGLAGVKLLIKLCMCSGGSCTPKGPQQ